MSEDLAHERVRPGVVRGALGGRERPPEEELEDGLPREIELAAKERGVERRVESRIGRLGDRRGRVGGALEPGAALRRRLREARGEIAFAEILDELVARRRRPPRGAGRARGPRAPRAPRPIAAASPPRRRDRRRRRTSGCREVDPEVAASPDVAGERLDRGGLCRAPGGRALRGRRRREGTPSSARTAVRSRAELVSSSSSPAREHLLDVDRLVRPVVGAARSRGDLVGHLHARDDFAERRVLAVEERRVLHDDEELRRGGVRVRRARAIDTMPRLCGVSLNSALMRPCFAAAAGAPGLGRDPRASSCWGRRPGS